MENEVSVYKPTYVLRRFDDEEVKITPDQYNGLETALLDSDVRFIKVGDTIINANSIKEVIKIVNSKLL